MVAMNIVRIYELFPTESDCITHLENVRWKGKPVCPYCGSDRATSAPAVQRYHCNNCKTSFSVTVGTIFHHTHLPFQKWLLAVSIVLNAKKGLSARQLARDLEVNKNTGWRMGMQIRKAMAEREQRELLSGVVQMDETYIGGKPRKSNIGSSGQDGGNKLRRGRGTTKTPVVGMLERGGRVRTKIVKKDDLTAKKLAALVRQHVDVENAILHTDEYKGYAHIKKFMEQSSTMQWSMSPRMALTSMHWKDFGLSLSAASLVNISALFVSLSRRIWLSL
jgi:transposase-like protein